MSSVSSWLLSIASVIMLSVLCEFILPEGQMNKYTKAIFSFVIIFVIICPISSLLSVNIDFSKLFSNDDYTLQEDYLYEVNLSKLSAISEDLAGAIENAGMKGVQVSISANVLCEELEIYSITVDLCDIEFSADFENKNIQGAKDEIEKIISAYSILSGVSVTYNSG